MSALAWFFFGCFVFETGCSALARYVSNGWRDMYFTERDRARDRMSR